MNEALIVSACRTPIGRFLGALKTFTAIELGQAAVAEAIRRASVPPERIDEVILGNVLSAGLGQAPARQVALGAGASVAVAALTINKVCGSGLKAVILAAQGIQVGDIEVAVAGGMESMSNSPHLLPGARQGYRMGTVQVLDSMIHDGLWDAYCDFHMGCTGEIVASRYSVSRQEQDRYAAESHRRALLAIREGWFDAELIPLEKGEGKTRVRVDQDEGPRSDSSADSLSRLSPAFQKGGTVTAGNSSQISDGAAALTVMSAPAAKKYGCRPLARIAAAATSGIEPELVMMAPLGAITKVLNRAGWNHEDVDLYEVNEAFAVQAVALSREVPIEHKKLNVHGGAVALGHPIGASGARILVTLLHALIQRNGKRGVAALCLGGGNAVALAVELI